MLTFRLNQTWLTLVTRSLACGFAVAICEFVSYAEEPKWIGASNPQSDAWQVERGITSIEAVQQARVKLAVDFADADLFINDQRVLEVEAYCPLQTMDVTNWMKQDKNRLRVEVQGVGGPSAIAIEVDLKFVSGRSEKVISDSQWQCASDPTKTLRSARELGDVRPELWGSGRRDISLAATENYEQWKLAAAGDTGPAANSKIWTVPGVEFAVLRTAAADEGSWISMAFDRQGKLLVSREDQGLLRMTLSADHNTIERVESINTDLQECRGLVFHGSTLYANANNSRGLYSLQYADDLASLQPAKLIREFPGSVGHGRNDLLIHGDWLYTIHGDSVDLPKDQINDLTSPLRHWAGDVSNREGQLLRMHLPTGAWELVCAGLRNPYGLAAQSDGSIFTFDADNEYDMGTPWYRPTRYVPLLAGGDIGYRTANHQLPPRFHDQPENVPPVLTIGRSSPTAIFHDNELRFPEPYPQATFLLDWTYGRVIAVHQVRRGASWRAHSELFLQGRPLNVTDIARGPDGAMYLITGGRKTQSSLLRVWSTAEQATRSRDEPHERDAARYSQSQIARLHWLDEQIRDRAPEKLDQVIEALADADPTIRHAARIALERLPVELWRSRVRHESQVTKWLFGCLALLQQPSENDTQAVLERWLQTDPSDLRLSEKLVSLRLVELCLRTNAQATLARSSQILSRLMQYSLSNDTVRTAPQGTSVEYRQRLALLIGQLSAQEPLAPIFFELLNSPLQEDQLTALLALRNRKNGWKDDDRRRQFEILIAARRMIGGEGLLSFVAAIEAESQASLSDEEKGKLADVLSAAKQEATQQLSQSPAITRSTARPFVRDWDIESLGEITNTSQVSGNRELGRQVFQEAQCDRCHRIGSHGTAVGPELTFVGRRFGTRDLLASILTPSQSVAENYQLETVLTDDGQVHLGRIVIEGDYRSETLVLQTDALRLDSIITIDKRRIESHQTIPKSPMPEGLLDSFTTDQIRDLLAYLQDPVAGTR